MVSGVCMRNVETLVNDRRLGCVLAPNRSVSSTGCVRKHLYKAWKIQDDLDTEYPTVNASTASFKSINVAIDHYQAVLLSSVHVDNCWRYNSNAKNQSAVRPLSHNIVVTSRLRTMVRGYKHKNKR